MGYTGRYNGPFAPLPSTTSSDQHHLIRTATVAYLSLSGRLRQILSTLEARVKPICKESPIYHYLTTYPRDMVPYPINKETSSPLFYS